MLGVSMPCGCGIRSCFSISIWLLLDGYLHALIERVITSRGSQRVLSLHILLRLGRKM